MKKIILIYVILYSLNSYSQIDRLIVSDPKKLLNIYNAWLYSSNCHSYEIPINQMNSTLIDILNKDNNAKTFKNNDNWYYNKLSINVFCNNNKYIISSINADDAVVCQNLKTGDTIINFNGTQLNTGTFDSLTSDVNLIKLDSVEMSLRENNGDLKSLTIHKPVHLNQLPLVKVINNNICYLVLKKFNDYQVQFVGDYIVDNNCNGGIIIDLRDNEGGHFPGIIEMASIFLTGNAKLFSLKGNKCSGNKTIYRKFPKCKYNEKVVLLVGKGTTYGAEMFAAALRDNGRALLIGDTTLGKHIVCSTFSLNDSENIKISTHETIRITGKPLSEGIIPDSIIPSSPAALYDNKLLEIATNLINDEKKFDRLMKKFKNVSK